MGGVFTQAGSKADLTAPKSYFRFAPESGLKLDIAPCQSEMKLALLPGGKGRRTFQCFECDRPDPLKSDHASGWLQGELRPPD
jgi:hypothetical protein